MEFLRQAEKFSVARRCLMLPHPEGIADSIADAFEACALGMRNLREGLLDQHAAAWLGRIQTLMDSTGVTASSERERWLARAAQLNVEEQRDLSRLVDELALWFARAAQNAK